MSVYYSIIYGGLPKVGSQEIVNIAVASKTTQWAS